MSAFGTKRTWRDVRPMSAIGGKADNELGEIARREADLIASFPPEVPTSVGRFSHSPSWNARLRSARAAGLGSRAPCPWHGHSCRESRQQHDGTSLRIRD